MRVLVKWTEETHYWGTIELDKLPVTDEERGEALELVQENDFDQGSDHVTGLEFEEVS